MLGQLRIFGTGDPGLSVGTFPVSGGIVVLGGVQKKLSEHF